MAKMMASASTISALGSRLTATAPAATNQACVAQAVGPVQAVASASNLEEFRPKASTDKSLAKYASSKGMHLQTPPSCRRSHSGRLPRINAVKAPEECNEEDCAPVKEVGKLSMDWLAEEKTKVAGTYPPLARTERKWTGYVEKDTAGQTNVYAVEPTVYVAESAISTGSAGGSGKGSDESLAVAFGLGLIAIASASSILLSVGKKVPETSPASAYSGPPLSYYIAKFNPPAALQAAVPEAPPLASATSLSQPQVAIDSQPLEVSTAPVETLVELPVESSMSE